MYSSQIYRLELENINDIILLNYWNTFLSKCSAENRRFKITWLAYLPPGKRCQWIRTGFLVRVDYVRGFWTTRMPGIGHTSSPAMSWPTKLTVSKLLFKSQFMRSSWCYSMFLAILLVWARCRAPQNLLMTREDRPARSHFLPSPLLTE